MTELTWAGKYDKNGRKTAPVRLALPFQTIETVNESTQDRQRTLDLFARGKMSDWRNRLIWGDKKYVLPALLPEFAGQVNLIYIDPRSTRARIFRLRPRYPPLAWWWTMLRFSHPCLDIVQICAPPKETFCNSIVW